MSPTAQIVAWGLAFLGSHLLLSHPPVRSPLVARLGRWRFRAFYSLASLATFVPWCWVWWQHRHAGALLWALRTPVVTRLAEALAVLGLVLAMGGYLRPMPSGMASGEPSGELRLRGFAPITRHPAFMGWALVCAAHVLVNGWAGDVAFFGGMILTSLIGSWHQDMRLAAERPGYAAFMAKTTLLPWPNPAVLRTLDARSLTGAGLGLGIAVVLRVFHAALLSG
jgi:uncharacterized membrane protein